MKNNKIKKVFDEILDILDIDKDAPISIDIVLKVLNEMSLSNIINNNQFKIIIDQIRNGSESYLDMIIAIEKEIIKNYPELLTILLKIKSELLSISNKDLNFVKERTAYMLVYMHTLNWVTIISANNADALYSITSSVSNTLESKFNIKPHSSFSLFWNLIKSRRFGALMIFKSVSVDSHFPLLIYRGQHKGVIDNNCLKTPMNYFQRKIIKKALKKEYNNSSKCSNSWDHGISRILKINITEGWIVALLPTFMDINKLKNVFIGLTLNHKINNATRYPLSNINDSDFILIKNKLSNFNFEIENMCGPSLKRKLNGLNINNYKEISLSHNELELLKIELKIHGLGQIVRHLPENPYYSSVIPITKNDNFEQIFNATEGQYFHLEYKLVSIIDNWIKAYLLWVMGFLLQTSAKRGYIDIFIAKLIIPSVLSSNNGAFFTNRSISLWIFLNTIINRRGKKSIKPIKNKFISEIGKEFVNLSYKILKKKI